MRRRAPQRDSPEALVSELAELRLRFGPETAGRRRELLSALRSARLADAESLAALHDAALFARAYPDDAATAAAADALLAGFAARPDLRRHRRELADTGIAGTDLHYPFFYPTAVWLARRHPQRLHVDWREWENAKELNGLLHLLLPYSESPHVDEYERRPRRWLELLRGPEEADGAFLARRFEALGGDEWVRETLYDKLSPPMRLEGGEGTPSRTLARSPVARPLAPQLGPLDPSRPDLAHVVPRLPLRVRAVDRRTGARFVDLAREAMVTRSRDLDAFANADARDVRLIECDGGLAFACLGARPERRLMVESVYGLLTLQNGVPMGYVLLSSLFGSTEIAYNVFDAFRGAEAARVFARVAAVAHRIFGARSFSIDPYQLGHFGNREGLESGAWWFYYKLGFRPRDPEVEKLVRAELARMRRNHRHRSDLETLDRLSAAHVFFSLGRHAGVALGALSPGQVGARISALLAERWGSDRERGLDACEREAASLLGVRSRAGWSPGERLGWRRWSPLVLALPGLERWSPAERRAVAAVVRAKGGRRESDYVRRFDAHRKLRRALLRLATPAEE